MKKKLNAIGKSLLVKADKTYYLVVLPADQIVDFEKLKKAISQQTKKTVKVVKIPGEKIMENLLKVKAGAMSAYGGIHKLPVILDKGLIDAKKAVFSSGSFNHSVEMLVKDFIKMENAILGSFGVKKKIAKPKKAKIPKKPKKRVVKKRVIKSSYAKPARSAGGASAGKKKK